MQNKIFVISGSSGVGKDYIINQTLKSFSNFKKAISYTDRDKRADDKPDAYHFISKEEFDKLIKSGEIFEWEFARDKRRYGSSKIEVIGFLESGENQIKIVGPKMFHNFKNLFGDKVVGIYLDYENIDLMKNRIRSTRPDMTEQDLEVRFNQAKQDIAFKKYYDYIVINPEGHPEIAVSKVEEIIKDNISNIDITEAKPDDIAEMCSVHKTAWLSTYAGDNCGLSENDVLSKDFDSPIKIKKWQDSLDDDNYKLWLAKDKEKIVGFAGAKKGEHENDFSVVYILPEYQRKGIGQAFAAKVFTWLGSEKPIKIELASCNKQAMNFYEKLGFTDPKTIEPLILNNGKKVEIIKMTKRS